MRASTVWSEQAGEQAVSGKRVTGEQAKSPE